MGAVDDKVVLIGLGSAGYDVLVEVKRCLRRAADEIENEKSVASSAGSGQDEATAWHADIQFLALGFDQRRQLPSGERLQLKVPARPFGGAARSLDPTLWAKGEVSTARRYAAGAWLAALDQESEILGRLRNLTDGLNIGGQVSCRYFFVCSLIDPEGVGLLLPIANLVRRMAFTDGWRENLDSRAFLLVPPNPGPLDRAQVAAALREIQQAEVHAWPPPSALGLQRDRDSEGRITLFRRGWYLAEPAHEGGPDFAPATAAQQNRLAAEWLAYVLKPEFQAELRRVKLDAPRSSHTPVAPVFCAFGLADYVVPVTELVEYCARRLAGEMVRKTLLADAGVGAVSEAAGFIDKHGLGSLALVDDLACRQPEQPMGRPVIEYRRMSWKRPGDIDRALAFRDGYEKQELPAYVYDLELRAGPCVAEVGEELRKHSLTLACTTPTGAFNRIFSFLSEVRRALRNLEIKTREENTVFQAEARSLLSALARGRAFALRCERLIAVSLRAAKWWTAGSLVLWVLGEVVKRILQGPRLRTVYEALQAIGLDVSDRLKSMGWESLGLAALFLLAWFLCRETARNYVARVMEYLNKIRSHHLREIMSEILQGARDRVRVVEGIIKALKTETEEMVGPRSPGLPQALVPDDLTNSEQFLGFPGRRSVATPLAVEQMYARGTGAVQPMDKAQVSRDPVESTPGQILQRFASEVFTEAWFERSAPDREEALFTYCRAPFLASGLPDAETLLIERLLESGGQPESAVPEAIAEELDLNFIPRMRPCSSHIETTVKPDRAIGLYASGDSRLRQAVHDLNLQRAQLNEISTGLRYRIVGLSFRYGLKLEDLRLFAECEAAYAQVEDPNLFHTRLVFSGRTTPSVPPEPSWTESARAEAPEDYPSAGEAADGRGSGPAASRPPADDADVPRRSADDDAWTEQWATIPEAGTPSEAGSAGFPSTPAGPDVADLAASYRFLGLETDASPEKVEAAYWEAYSLYNPDTGSQKDGDKMAEFNLAYDRIKAGWRVAA